MEFRSNGEVALALLSGILDDAEGQGLLSTVKERVPQGGKLIVDGSRLTRLTPEGAEHLIAVQKWASTPDRRRLRLVGFGAAPWQEVVRQHAEWLFDSLDTVEEAGESLGVAAMPSTPEELPETKLMPPTPPPPPPPTVVTTATQGGPFYPGMDGPASVPPPPPPIVSRPPPPMAGIPGRSSGGSKPGQWVLLAGAAVLILIGLVFWWRMQSNRPPVVTVSNAVVTAEEDGKEMDGVTVQVQRGKLLEKSWDGLLPQGLYFDAASSEDRAENAYFLHGRAEQGAKSATVQLEAADVNGKHSPPVAFTVNVTEKPLTWQLNTLQSLGLEVNRAILGASKFVTGASEVSTPAGLPPGLRTEPAPGTSKDWQLAGMPAKAGHYRLVFKASSPAGAPEEKACELDIAGESAPPLPPPQPSAPPARSAEANAAPPKPPAAQTAAAVDDGMRKFLLDRIEKLPSRYTSDDRENLRLVVNGLKQARLVQRVIFEHVGQTELSPEQADQLKTVLQSADNQALLKNPDCQIAVVGYASKGGSLASNVRISKARARAVDVLCKEILGRNADLCGDYGPTDVVDQGAEQANRAVEIYVGLLNLPVYLRSRAVSFRDDFNRRHGAH